MRRMVCAFVVDRLSRVEAHLNSAERLRVPAGSITLYKKDLFFLFLFVFSFLFSDNKAGLCDIILTNTQSMVADTIRCSFSLNIECVFVLFLSFWKKPNNNT